MRLSDGGILAAIARGDFVVTPFEMPQLQPGSYDLRLGEDVTISYGDFLLSFTLEHLSFSPTAALDGTLKGKSTRARQGLIVEAAGLCDAGWRGHPTLELYMMQRGSLHLSKGDLICQLTLDVLDAIPLRPYGHPALDSHYQDQPARAVPALGFDRTIYLS